MFRRTYSPWFEDEQCKNFRISFNTQKSLPIIGLVSFPRSGNTWARRLFEGTTGIFTGSIYYNTLFTTQGILPIVYNPFEGFEIKRELMLVWIPKFSFQQF